MDINSIEKVECGVDWVTLTGQGVDIWERVQGMAQSILFEESAKGHRINYQSRHGFSMTNCGGVQYGKNHSHWMVCLSGVTARRYWMPFSAYADNCTRIDLQATVWYNEHDTRAIERVWEKAVDDRGEAIAKKATLIVNRLKGSSLYFGSRASAQFGRLYDKWLQSGKEPHYLNALRYEVEYKKPLSGQVLQWLLKDDPPDDRIGARVFNWWGERGISVPLVETISDNAIQFPERNSPLENKLEWLRKSIRPVYRQMKLAGLQTEADEAIGVTEDIQTITQPIKE